MTETLGFPPPSLGNDESARPAAPAAPASFAPPTPVAPATAAPPPVIAAVPPAQPLPTLAASPLPTLAPAAPARATTSGAPSMPALPPLPTFTIRDEPVAPVAVAPVVEPAGPVVITEDMLGSFDFEASPHSTLATPIVTSVPAAAPLTEIAKPTKVATFDPGKQGAAPATPMLPNRTRHTRPTARQPRTLGSTLLKLAVVALLLTLGWIAWSKFSADNDTTPGPTDANGQAVTPITDASGQAVVMPPTQVGMPPIQVLPNASGQFLVTVGPVQFVMPSLPTQTGASDPSQPNVAAVKFTASGPAGVITAVVTLDTRPLTVDSRTAFCDAALASTLTAETATATADTVVSKADPVVHTATYQGPTGVGDFHCHYDDDYAVVLTGVGVNAPMGAPFADTVTSLTFHA